MRVVAAVIALALAVLACTDSGAGLFAPTPSPFTVDVVDIGRGRQLEVGCAGAGSPTVILEHGNGGSMDDWSPIIPAVARFTRVCAYNRAGTGRSTEPTDVRTGAGAAADLDALIAAAGLEPPFVLVGHSLGGLLLPVHLDRHAGDVAGLLFVDPAVPGTFERLEAALGEPVPGEPASVAEVRFAFGVGWPKPEEQVERLDIRALEVESAEVGSFGDTPTIVLSADNMFWSVRDRRAEQATREAWYEAHQELAARSTEGRHEVVDGSDHGIQGTVPSAVIEAIRELVDNARAEAGRRRPVAARRPGGYLVVVTAAP